MKGDDGCMSVFVDKDTYCSLPSSSLLSVLRSFLSFVGQRQAGKQSGKADGLPYIASWKV